MFFPGAAHAARHVFAAVRVRGLLPFAANAAARGEASVYVNFRPGGRLRRRAYARMR